MHRCASRASGLLSVWEQGAYRGSAGGALLLLEATAPADAAAGPATLSIGRRDAELLAIRRELFGPALEALADCPACGETLEFACDVADVLANEAGAGPPDGAMEVRHRGWVVRFRLPDGGDAAAAAATGDVAAARQMLLERSLLAARRGEEPVAAGDLPPDVIAALGERMLDEDPQADVEVALTCPACGERWGAPFDIAGYLWAELEAWASRTLADVHALAAAYGWTEREILGLGTRRRGAYLHLIEAS